MKILNILSCKIYRKIFILLSVLTLLTFAAGCAERNDPSPSSSADDSSEISGAISGGQDEVLTQINRAVAHYTIRSVRLDRPSSWDDWGADGEPEILVLVFSNFESRGGSPLVKFVAEDSGSYITPAYPFDLIIPSQNSFENHFSVYLEVWEDDPNENDLTSLKGDIPVVVQTSDVQTIEIKNLDGSILLDCQIQPVSEKVRVSMAVEKSAIYVEGESKDLYRINENDQEVLATPDLNQIIAFLNQIYGLKLANFNF